MTTKPVSRKRRKKPAKPVGARALLLTLALGGSLGGWAGLAFSATRTDNAALSPAATAPAPDVMALASTSAPETPLLQLPPIPTVQPPPADLAANALQAAPSLPEPVSLAPIPAVPQPVIQRPVVRTRSSR